LSSVPSRGELYDWEQTHVIGRSDQDLAFHRHLIEEARPRASVLELGCGTGRVAIPMHDAGVDIVGVDIDAVMLAVARARHATVRLACADARRFAFARPFDVVLAPYNFLQLLATTADRIRCLRTVAAHLAPGGAFATEVHDFFEGGEGADVEPEPLHAGSLGADEVTLYGGLRQDRATRTTTYTRRFQIALGDGSTHVVHDDTALYSFAPGELSELLHTAGLAGRRETEGVVERWVARRIG
jgi:SAM-dependent methyltransferase